MADGLVRRRSRRGRELDLVAGAGTGDTRNTTNVVLERTGSGTLLRRYTYGLDLVSQTSSNKGPYWYHHDGLGSVTDLTSATGSPLAWTEYTPFGTIRAAGATSQAPTNPFRFTGAYLDGTTALYHLRARQYDPTTGRFTSTDPAKPLVGRPCVSAYSYARNNPVRFVDPSGRESQPAGDQIQQTSGFCTTTIIASAAIFLSLSVLDFALGFVTFWAPEAHALPPFQALDLIAIGGTLGAVGGVVHGGSHSCETKQ